MRQKTSSRIFVGDIVTTNKNFTPKKPSGQLISLGGEQYRGVVVSRRGDDYGVRFCEGLDFTNTLDGMLKKPTGYLMKKEEMTVEDI